MTSRRPKGRRLHWRAEEEANATLCGSWGAPYFTVVPERLSCIRCRTILDARQENTGHDAPKGAA